MNWVLLFTRIGVTAASALIPGGTLAANIAHTVATNFQGTVDDVMTIKQQMEKDGSGFIVTVIQVNAQGQAAAVDTQTLIERWRAEHPATANPTPAA